MSIQPFARTARVDTRSLPGPHQNYAAVVLVRVALVAHWCLEWTPVNLDCLDNVDRHDVLQPEVRALKPIDGSIDPDVVYINVGLTGPALAPRRPAKLRPDSPMAPTHVARSHG